MRRNSHVRFGAGDEETCLGDEARRFIPTLPKSLAVLLTLIAQEDREKHDRPRRTRPAWCFLPGAFSCAFISPISD